MDLSIEIDYDNRNAGETHQLLTNYSENKQVLNRAQMHFPPEMHAWYLALCFCVLCSLSTASTIADNLTDPGSVCMPAVQYHAPEEITRL
jgi:hypothetical protein